MTMIWYPILGYGIFWIGLVLAVIMFATMRKFYPILYLASISVYIFTLGFVIDVFDVGKEGILILLAFSTLLMITIGMSLAKSKQKKKKR